MNKRPAFFGYNDASKITVVYLPNANQMYPSGQSTAELENTPAETSGMIKNGAQVAIMGGSANLAMLLLDLQLVHIVLGINVRATWRQRPGPTGGARLHPMHQRDGMHQHLYLLGTNKFTQ